MGDTKSASDGVYHRFSPDFREKVGYLLDDLPDNRVGRLAPGQQIFFVGDAFRLVFHLVIAVGAIIGLIFVLASRSYLKPVEFMGVAGLLLAFGAAFSFSSVGMVRDLNRDRVGGKVESFCGELTRWVVANDEGISDDLHGLEHQSHRVNVTARAWSALPERAHYRIYFTPHQRNVINVEEHTDGAPHVWPTES